MPKGKKYLVNEDDLRNMLEAQSKLQMLENDGVDNWSGYYVHGEEVYRDYERDHNLDEGSIDGHDDIAIHQLESYEVAQWDK